LTCLYRKCVVTDMVDTIYKWCDAILMCLCRKSVVIDVVR